MILKKHSKIIKMSNSIQLDPDNSNSDNSKSPLIRSNIHFPWTPLLPIFISLIRTPVNSSHFPFPLGLRINGVQLYSQCCFCTKMNIAKVYGRANARNISYTSNPTGENNTISTLVDQTHIQLTRERRKNRGFF